MIRNKDFKMVNLEVFHVFLALYGAQSPIIFKSYKDIYSHESLSIKDLEDCLNEKERQIDFNAVEE